MMETYRLARLVLALLLAGCTVEPTPSLIANCRASQPLAVAGPPVRSLLVATDDAMQFRCWTCRDLLRDWQLDFVEFPSRAAKDRVDRARILPAGHASCTALPKEAWRPLSRLPFRMRAPRGSCLGVELDQESAAEAELRLWSASEGDHSSENFHAVRRPGGEPMLRLTNYTIRPAEAPAVTCHRIVPSFPADPFRFAFSRIAAPRGR
ncbi:MAG TPA: hypothetical protein VF702_05370 [Allosphingosinicella sp.]|jgi:hypothetical protein